MIYAILGPTGSGKSDIVETVSKRYNIPVINFDVFQMYKEIDKGTAKPEKELINSGRYYLYDCIDLNEAYDVASYQKEARKTLDFLLKEHKDVILVGGNGLYLKALLYNYTFNEEDPMPKDYLSDLSNEELYKKVESFDAEDAKKIDVNNRKRLLRAIYIFETHKVNKTELNQNGKDELLYKDVKYIGIDIDREKLYERINFRVDMMFESGLAQEVRDLINKYGKDTRGLQAIGYKEFFELENEEEIKELIKKNSRNYAKRQMTFFRHQFENVNWFKSRDEALNFLEEEITNERN